MKERGIKAKLLLLVCCVFCVGLLCVGCGGKTTTEKTAEEKYSDELFVKDMAKGLQERWKLSSEDESKESFADITVDSEEYKNMMLKYIDAELSIIEKYGDEKFEDSKLKELAIKYINLLNEHKEICQYMTVDYEKYAEEFTPIYNERSKIISQMVNDYKMTVSEEYQSTLDEFMTNSTLVKEEEGQREAVGIMLGAVTFEVTEDDGSGWKTYQGIVENTTGTDFDNMSFDINLLDENGVIVETTYDQVSAFKNGAKAQLEFMTDKEFTSTEILATWYE